jgi:mRNA-degrading endonuclease RelE of RelBE toxin-antitoxin system
MRLIPTPSYERDLSRLPRQLQRRAVKALELLRVNPRHPSLHFKRIKGSENLWEARVTQNYRIVWSRSQVRTSTYELLALTMY